MSNTDISFEARAHVFKEPKGNTLGLATLNIGGVFAVNNIRIMNSENGPFVALPSIKDKDGNFKDICHPVTKEARAEINSVVMDAYYVALSKETEKSSAAQRLQEAQREAEQTPFRIGDKDTAEPEL